MSDSYSILTGDSGYYGKDEVAGESGILKVAETGRLTVVNFGGCDVPHTSCLSKYQDEIAQLIEENQCEVLRFDLTRVKVMPSGLLVSTRNQGIVVQVENASALIRNTFEVMHLDKLIEIL